MGAANATAWVPYLIGINIAVGLLVAWAVWAFRSGRWVEEQTNAHAELQREIDTLHANVRRDISDLKTGLTEEHKQRREFMDRTNEVVVKLSTTVARHDERLKMLEPPR